MKLSRNTFFQCRSQKIDPVAIRMFKHGVFEEIPPFVKIQDFGHKKNVRKIDFP